MSVDYDLVVIGSSYEGIYAAERANSLKARVALVTQGDQPYLPGCNAIFNQSFGEITRFINQLQDNIWGLSPGSGDIGQINLVDIHSWHKLVLQRLQAEYSLSRLAAAGVDMIFGQGEFCRRPQQAFLVGKRKLRSRKYLVATGARYTANSIAGCDRINCLTIDDLWQNDCLANLPHNITIIGNSSRSLELAQGLAQFNKQINLVIPETRILPQEDIKMVQLIQAQLTADGIDIFTQAKITNITENNNQKIIHLEKRSLTTEAIIFTDDYEVNIAGLNLQGVGVKSQTSGIRVNHKLQTTNKDIYACGDVIGGLKSTSIACHEANIALQNILFFTWGRKADPNKHYIPQVIFTQPSCARLGINRAQAIRDYGKNIYLIKEYFKTIPQAQFSGNTTGWCEMILRPNGKILGCTIIGDRAEELIATIAVMMQYNIKLNQNSRLRLLQVNIPVVSPSFAEILQRVATSFYQQKLQCDRRLNKRLENWFRFRKKWNF
ncbi:pyruvate/2-oxoglutarate dehydrogenase complex, dihydrolipoamide dehydrogenase component [Xenococcus sp. PCC 7305]|uniref:FAD-dependent oxidoreductase n=1 Tax=Xenococcus sp. PCC 7305 TaxID=102125 RepID=UPI0002AC4F6F|nr:FAD-dependent oxidoreductase [Xenococcus sp. PCC 7305]ELS00707.1 pyruvate/2-oxoglutarate dehydrogenase complex, dihydrolipoamide dehydrogenase component [Xenococcus sp. PCC 7305]